MDIRMMNNNFRSRLSATIYTREEDENRIEPKRVYFLSVEGNVTEKEYFENIQSFSDELEINSLVKIEVLKRRNNDTRSAPKDVIELLEEYIHSRSEDSIPSDIPESLLKEFDETYIKEYLTNHEALQSRDQKKFEDFETKLIEIGYDLKYKSYLNRYHNDSDKFCIIIDRDSSSHSAQNLIDCINYCEAKNYKLYISNPCFEFWLLLHLSNVITEYKDQLELLKENKKVSSHNTYIGNIISNKTHSRKSISINRFKAYYLPNVDKAVERSHYFSTNLSELIDNLGTNICDLIEEMKRFDE